MKPLSFLFTLALLASCAGGSTESDHQANDGSTQTAIDPGTVVGSVVDESGRGIGMLSVVLQAHAPDSAIYGAVTEPEGHFLIHGVAPGRYTAEVRGPGVSIGDTLDVLAADTTSLELVAEL